MNNILNFLTNKMLHGQSSMSKPGTSVFTISPVLVLPKDGCSHFARCHPSERKPSAQTHVYAKGICQVFFFPKNIWNYFTSCDPHHGILRHLFWHLCSNLETLTWQVGKKLATALGWQNIPGPFGSSILVLQRTESGGAASTASLAAGHFSFRHASYSSQPPVKYHSKMALCQSITTYIIYWLVISDNHI